MSKHIAVLKGGWSPEREISLITARACTESLKSNNYDVTEIDVQPNFADQVKDINPDICFNALHGQWGEDGCVQGILNILKIPYTHSGVLSSSIAMNKVMTKRVVASENIQTPQTTILNTHELDKLNNNQIIEYPYVIKPVCDGSSLDVFIVKNSKDRDQALQQLIKKSRAIDYLIEPFIDGQELTVGVMDGKALAVTEMRTQRGFFDYKAKYAHGEAQHILPAEIPSDIYEKAKKWAEITFKTLECRGIARVDFRYNPNIPNGDGLYFLEINTQPGMTPLSSFPEQAQFCGVPHTELVKFLVETACYDE